MQSRPHRIPDLGRLRTALPLLVAAALGGCDDPAFSPTGDALDLAEAQRSASVVGEVLAADREYGEAMGDPGAGMFSFFEPGRVVRNAPVDKALAGRPRGAEKPEDALARRRAHTRTTTRAVIDMARQRRRGEIMRFIVNLSDPAYDFTRLANLEDDARLNEIEQRRESLRPSQDAAQAVIEEMGGKVIARQWVVNALVVEAAGPTAVAIMELPMVESATLADVQETPGARYDGTDVRNAVRSQSMWNQAMWGESLGRTTTPTDNIKIGIIDVDPLNTNHVGWLDWAGGPSRIRANYNCSGGVCVPATALPTGAVSHGTRVASLAAGGISQGQDTAIPGYTDLLEHSWSSEEAEIYYYHAGGGSAAAMQKAIEDGVDILNMSIGISCSLPNNYQCSPYYDCANINAILRAGLDAGMVSVACAGNGNQGGAGTCDLWWPGYRPETIAVNALDTSNDAVAYHDTTFTWYSTTGPIPITMYGGASGSFITTPGVDLVAPAETRFTFGNGTNDYADMNGCSGATPVVAGALGVLREAFNSIGWSGNNARALMVNALLMGDASDGSTPNGESNSNVHSSAGYGRLHMHVPTNWDMIAPWGWGWRSVVIHQGEELRYTVWDAGPENPAVTEWKMAVTWDAPDLLSVPDIVIKVVDTCNGDAVIAQDYSYALRKRLHLTQPQIANRCLEMRVYGWSVPPGGTVVYMADYFHAGDTSVH